MPLRKGLAIVAVTLAGVGFLDPLAKAERGGQLQIDVVDRDTAKPIACRMHLKGPAGKSAKADNATFWADHLAFSQSVTLRLRNGHYDFELERGPEYLVRSGRFTIADFADDQKSIDLKRFVDMAREGWWSGDLDIERSAKDIELLMQAEDLHIAELIRAPKQKEERAIGKNGAESQVVQFDGNRYYQLSTATASRGPLLLLNLSIPLAVQGRDDFASLWNSLEQTRHAGGWIDVAKPSAWDLPIWVAHQRVDSIELAPSVFGRTAVVENETGCKPRDKSLFPGPAGLGRWTETIYYHLLNCGLRIPPTAGSGSGQTLNPPGYNRVYVHVAGDFSYQRWFENLRAGQVVVTNGPMIRPIVEGELPGHVFRGNVGQELTLEIGLTLSTRDKIDYLEVVQNGHPVYQARLDDWAKQGGKLPPVRFSESGWFLVRAVSTLPHTYRFASTGAYFVEIGYRPRISKASAQFFLDWVNERIAKLEADHSMNQPGVKATCQAARKYWEDLVSRASAD